MRFLSVVCATLPLSLALALSAQDTRNVTEPHIPAACVTLKAAIEAKQGNITEEDERKLDTLRIQDAMDHCSPGKAVVLRSDARKSVFIAGPLTLRSGVTLVIAANTSLIASRDPRVYDIAPGSCGVVAERGHGCKPFITGEPGAKGGAIMGEGSIDSRGGAKLLGQDVTWWDLAHEAKVKDLQQSVPGHDRSAPRRRLYDVQDHPAQLAGLSCFRWPDGWIHGMGA